MLAFSGAAGGTTGKCISITSLGAKNNTFLSPYLTGCYTGIVATAGAGNLIANGNFVGTTTAIGTDTGLTAGLLYKPQLYGAMFQNGVLPNTNCIGAGIAFVSCFDAGDNTQQLFVDGTAKVYFGLSSGHRLKIVPNASGGQFDLTADELGALDVVVFFEPVGVHQARRIILGMLQDAGDVPMSARLQDKCQHLSL